MKKEVFETVFTLSNKHPWLSLNSDGLMSLLYEDCKSEEEKELVIQLISDFYYMTEKKYKENIIKIADNIINLCLPNETVIYATAGNRETDSSQAIVYDLRTILAKKGGNSWQGAKIFSAMSKSVLYGLDPEIIKNIYIIDEFNGSGKTILSRYKKICSDIRSLKKEPEDYNIQVIYITSIECAHKYVESEGINLTSLNILKKGITFNDNIKNKDKAIELIKKISLALSPEFKKETMYPLGYNNSEGLYYREDGNVPNSVFSIFWWPEYTSLKERNSLIVRAISNEIR